MKTTIDIPEEALRDAIRFTKAKTKKDAILTVVNDFNRRHRMAALTKHLGTFDSLMSNDEIETLEASRPRGRS